MEKCFWTVGGKQQGKYCPGGREIEAAKANLTVAADPIEKGEDTKGIEIHEPIE